MTRRELVLQLLTEAGGDGVTTGDFLRAGAGSRFGARIAELRADGYAIHAERVRDGEWRYWLAEDLFDIGPGAASGGDPPSAPARCSAGSGVEPAGPEQPPDGGAVTPDERREVVDSGALFELPGPRPQSGVEGDWEADAA